MFYVNYALLYSSTIALESRQCGTAAHRSVRSYQSCRCGEEVDAFSTHDLMLEFYRSLKSGADKATALKKTQIKIMEKKEYAHPYYWAPFVLVGNWQ